MRAHTILATAVFALLACRETPKTPAPPPAPTPKAATKAPEPPPEPSPRHRFRGPLSERLADITQIDIRTYPMGSEPYTYAKPTFALNAPKDIAALIAALGADQPARKPCPKCREALKLTLTDAQGPRGRLGLFCVGQPALAIFRAEHESGCWTVRDPVALKALLLQHGGAPTAPEP